MTDIVERLRRYKRDRSGYAVHCHQAADEIERLRLDAARYRWLREQAHWEDERDMAPGGRWWLAVMVNRGKPTFDSAIDAAMKG